MPPTGYDSVIDCLSHVKIIAVLRNQDPTEAMELVRAYAEGGLRAIELTTSIPDWERVLIESKRMDGHDTCIGLGTVTSSEVARQAVDAGAEFIVSPVTIPDVITTCQVLGVPVIPGALTPTEIFQAVSAGADLVKVYPVTSVGGAQYIRTIMAPFPDLKLVTSGGVRPEDAVDYLRAGAFAVGLGDNLAPDGAIARKDWKAISTSVADLLSSIRKAMQTSK